MIDVAILCTDPAHPVNPWLLRWAEAQAGRARVAIRRDFRELEGGDFLFLVSCHQIIKKPTRDLYRHTLVLHASALPQGRGMSPHIWQLVQGAREITLTLLNAEDGLDSGDIWHQLPLAFDGTELHHEINARLFDAELELMSWALEHCDRARPRAQQGEGSFFRKRTPEDSRIDPTRPLAESFDLLRVADPERYPAFFEWRGRRYRLRLDPA
jgi:methionyl-tRNA formyltransferase